MQIRISFDGESMTLDAPITVAELLAGLDLDPHILSVVRNGEVLRRADYPGSQLADGDELAAVVQVGGG